MYRGFNFKEIDYIQYKEYRTMLDFSCGIAESYKMLRYGEYMTIITTSTEMAMVIDLLALSPKIKNDLKFVALNICYDGKCSIEEVDQRYLEQLDSDVIFVNEDYFPYSYSKYLINKTNNVLFYHVGKD